MLSALMYTRDVSPLPCVSWFAQTACMHLWFAQTSLVHFGLHELHSCILVCMSTCVSPTHFACFIGVHSDLVYTQVIHSKPNTCVRTYDYTTESIPYIAVSVTLLSKFMVSHRDIQMNMCILTL